MKSCKYMDMAAFYEADFCLYIKKKLKNFI